MKLIDYLPKECITVELEGESKEEVLANLVDLLVKGKVVDEEWKNGILESLKEREELGSTAIGYGVAIPHGKAPVISEIALAVGISKKGVDFDSLDGKPVHLFFLLVASPSHATLYLKALARISRFLRDSSFRDKLLKARSPQEVFEIIKEREEKEVPLK